MWKYQDENAGEIYRFRLDDLNRKLRLKLKHDFSKDFLLPTLEMNGFLLFTRKSCTNVFAEVLPLHVRLLCSLRVTADLRGVGGGMEAARVAQ